MKQQPVRNLLTACLVSLVLLPAAGPAAGASLPDVLLGRWRAQGVGKEVEMGAHVVTSTVGLPAGQRIGTVGNGQVGTYDWGVRQQARPYQVQRSATLVLNRDGSFAWNARTESARSEQCLRTTQFSMSGVATAVGETLVLDIADGQQTVAYNAECSGDRKQESLAGTRRVYAFQVERGGLSLRQIEPKSSIMSAVHYSR